MKPQPSSLPQCVQIPSEQESLYAVLLHSNRMESHPHPQHSVGLKVIRLGGWPDTKALAGILAGDPALLFLLCKEGAGAAKQSQLLLRPRGWQAVGGGDSPVSAQQ